MKQDGANSSDEVGRSARLRHSIGRITEAHEPDVRRIRRRDRGKEKADFGLRIASGAGLNAGEAADEAAVTGGPGTAV
jgi:hypothetical protein